MFLKNINSLIIMKNASAKLGFALRILFLYKIRKSNISKEMPIKYIGNLTLLKLFKKNRNKTNVN